MGAAGTLTIYTRKRGEWSYRFWMLLARLPRIGPYRRLRYVSNAVASQRWEVRVGRNGKWSPAPPIGAAFTVGPYQRDVTIGGHR